MEGGSLAPPGAAHGLHVTWMLGVRASTRASSGRVRGPYSRDRVGPGTSGARGPDGGWADTQRGQSPRKTTGRPSQRGGAPCPEWTDKEETVSLSAAGC